MFFRREMLAFKKSGGDPPNRARQMFFSLEVLAPQGRRLFDSERLVAELDKATEEGYFPEGVASQARHQEKRRRQCKFHKKAVPMNGTAF
jgi:hypothetical protein